MIELDYEVKGKKSLFSEQISVYEKHRQLLVGARREVRKGMFSRERNITQALKKHGGLPDLKQVKDDVSQYTSV